MNLNYLSFEQPIAELEGKIAELQLVSSDNRINIGDELTESIYSNLTPWQIVQVARHPQRPYASDYIARMFTDWEELHGDRHFGDDKAIIGGIGRLNGRPVMVIGEEKGRSVQDKVSRNFGMPKPEGYRKALRLMRLAERFGLPLVTFIDTQGAYPGVGAEERGQSEAIARNIYEMSVLRVPIVSVVTGEGGSGGAIAIGVCDRLLMLQYSVYSVISPEGCASILWKSADKKEAAAEAMGLTAQRLSQLGLVDEVIEEPLGGAHRNHAAIAERLKAAILRQLSSLEKLSPDELRAQRQAKIASFGVFSES
jgi:acetyl-CoA carboxylase carboxyl transferase subunit alpha